LVSVDDYIKKSKSWKHLRKIYRAKTITFSAITLEED
jgi:hypothetical protein